MHQKISLIGGPNDVVGVAIVAIDPLFFVIHAPLIEFEKVHLFTITFDDALSITATTSPRRTGIVCHLCIALKAGTKRAHYLFVFVICL